MADYNAVPNMDDFADFDKVPNMDDFADFDKVPNMDDFTDKQSSTTAPSTYDFADIPEYNAIATHQPWLNATRTVYNIGKNEQTKWQGSDEELAQWGIEHMSFFNSNFSLGMTVDAVKLVSSSPEQKEAFLYLMETYDEIDEPNLPAMGRFTKGLLTDPLTYIGIGTYGAGFLGTQAAKQATRQGLKELLKQGVKRGGAIGLFEGSFYGFGDATVREAIRVGGSDQESIDWGNVAKSTAISSVAGLTLGTGADVGITKITNKLSRKNRLAELKAERLEKTKSVEVAEGEVPVAKVADEAPDLPAVQDVDGMPIDIPYFNTALTAPLRNLESIAKRAEGLIPDIVKMSPARFVKVAEQIRNSELTVESRSNLDQVIQGVRDHFLREQEKKLGLWAKATNPEEKLRLRAELAEAEVHLGIVADLDADLAGAAGMGLKQRDNLFISGKGYTVKELTEQFPNLSPDEILYKQRDVIAEGRAKNRIKQTAHEYDVKLEAALEAKDASTYLKVFREKRKAIDNIIEEEGAALASSKKGAVQEALYKFAAPAVEVTISNAFSVSTLLLNVGVSSLKTLYRPALDFAIGGKWNKQARLEMMAGYAGIRAMRKSAFKAALTSFKYEKQVATFETNKMFDEDIKIKGIKGAILRTFPRLLLASDSFLQDINYRGYVSARATNDAYEVGVKNGLKGKKLDAFIKGEVKTKVDAAYDTNLRKETIDAIYRKGTAKGLKGEALDDWVTKALVKDESGLFSYNDKGALDYSNDILFKKEFSGKGLLSGSASKYEKMVREWPVAKLLLNLFWRTPIRVFEEGIRLTPALNTVASRKFRDDLIGKNGNKAQLRARGEMLLGQALVMDTIAMMSAGHITGANHPEHPYSIRVWDEDGEEQWWSYRLADPLSTPIKIMINAMEEYQILLLRQQQEGRVDKKVLEQFWDDNSIKFQAGLIGITTTLADARLLTGFSKAYEGVFGDNGMIAQAVNDPTDEDKPVLSKKMFEMMSAAFPRQAYKLYERDDPTRYQTASFGQMLRKNALPYYNVLEEYGDPLLEQLGVDLDIKSFKAKLTPAFDINGIPITNPDPMASNLIFSATKESQFQEGLNEDQIAVREGLFKLSLNANTSFFHPYRYKKGYGDEDLRTLYTAATGDRPEESYMSRWMHYYRELAPEAEIRDILDDPSIPEGVPSNSPKVKAIRSLMRHYKEEAWAMLADDEPDIQNRMEEKELTEELIEEGQLDTIQ